MRKGWSKWGWTRWLLEVSIAITLFLLLALVNQSIFRNALALVGYHPDSPLIFSVMDACGNEATISFAAVPRGLDVAPSSDSVCNNHVTIRATAKPNREVLLVVNGRVVESRRSHGIVNFEDVRLRKGFNRLSVRYGDSYAEKWFFPYFTNSMGAQLQSLSSNVRNTSSIDIKLPWAFSTAPRLLRVWTLEDGSSWGLVQGKPHSRINIPNVDHRVYLGKDGMRIVQLRAESVPPDTGVPVRREIVLTRNTDGTVGVTAKACLAEDHALLTWAREGYIEGPELITRLFGILVGGLISANDPLWRNLRPVELDEPDGGCLPLRISYMVPEGQVWLSSWDMTFPDLPGDKLVLEGFTGVIEVQGRTADQAEVDRLIWRGRVPFAADTRSYVTSTISIYPTFAPRLEEQQTDKKDEETQKKDEKTQPERRVLAAWRNLAELLPGLLRASLWGLSAAAPVALMLWGFVRYGVVSPQSDQWMRGRVGLLALLAFMLTLAFQRLMIELVRSLVNVTHIDVFVNDSVSS